MRELLLGMGPMICITKPSKCMKVRSGRYKVRIINCLLYMKLQYSLTTFQIDRCNRLWVMDAGKIGDAQRCPPQVLAFDLNTDTLLYRHVVNASNYIATSLYITPVGTKLSLRYLLESITTFMSS
jgi:hypothetical protein